jgi:hypothetical protein
MAWSPVVRTDPAGRYSCDVHYGLTYFLALAAGYTRGEAATVALEDWDVDRDPATDSEVAAARGAWDVVTKYHFPIDPTQHKVVEGGTAAWERVAGATDLMFLGSGLHTLQDSYSHHGAYIGNITDQEKQYGLMGKGAGALAAFAGKVKNRDVGIIHQTTPERVAQFGLVGGLKSVDWTYTDSALLVRAAQATYDALLFFKLQRGEISRREARAIRERWDLIDADVVSFAVASTIEQKRQWFSRLMPWAVDLIDWDEIRRSGLAER